jgi:hypothetical protein
VLAYPFVLLLPLMVRKSKWANLTCKREWAIVSNRPVHVRPY